MTPDNFLHTPRIQAQLARTHCPKGHPYSGYNLIRKGTQRHCRECKNALNRIYQRQIKAAAHETRNALKDNGQQCLQCSGWFCNISKRHPNVTFCSTDCQQKNTKSRRFQNWKCARCYRQRDKGYKHCSIHRKGTDTPATRRAKKNARIAQGVCVQCGRNPIKPGTKRFCRDCLLYHNFKMMERGDRVHDRHKVILKGDILPPQAAQLAGVTRSVIYQRINRGSYQVVKHRLPYVKKRGTYQVHAIAHTHRIELEQEGFLRQQTADWLSTDTFAAKWFVSPVTVSQWCEKGWVKAVRLPGAWRISPDAGLPERSAAA